MVFSHGGLLGHCQSECLHVVFQKFSMELKPKKPSVSFVVPALNEEGNIEATTNAILRAAEGCLSAFEVILVNDGSTDRTGAIMDRLAMQNPCVRVVHNAKNLGYGGAFKAGAAQARMDYVVRICGDDCSPPFSIQRILQEIGKADIVIPYVSNPELRSWLRRLGSWGFTTLVNVLFGFHVPYYNHAVVFRREHLNAIVIKTDGFAYQAEAIVKLLKAGCTFTTIGVEDIPRAKGKSTALKPKNLARVLKAIVALAWEVYRPTPIRK